MLPNDSASFATDESGDPNSLPSVEHVEMKPILPQSLCPTLARGHGAAISGQKTRAMSDSKEITDEIENHRIIIGSV